MNTATIPNGKIQTWLDGELALDVSDIRFRDAETFAVDAVLFQTFFGGSDRTWAATKDEWIEFDDIVISTHAISH